ncbi:hypothetical protein CEXT_696181 [Caerostris extrusa]|uniref:Uncharacterized protein n=1 Tax=Caerostris extrusa TaxID=172846 RepID=A0AAV4PI08_CAEEX|nr:hypothetical protein CEXT_696181 [Caerostris extrusa]
MIVTPALLNRFNLDSNPFCNIYNIQQFIILYKLISNNLKMPISLDECATNASPVNENWKENIYTTDAHASDANGTRDTPAIWKHFKMPITHVEYATMPVSSTTAVVSVENLPVTSTSVIVNASTIVPEDTLIFELVFSEQPITAKSVKYFQKFQRAIYRPTLIERLLFRMPSVQ